MQAFQWVADGRLRWLVDRSTFDLSELSSGQADLFIAVPPEYKRLLAPFLRWLLSDLFASIRARRPIERVLVFVDEAAALGRFDEILTAAAELPGYGRGLGRLARQVPDRVSLWRSRRVHSAQHRRSGDGIQPVLGGPGRKRAVVAHSRRLHGADFKYEQ